RCSLAVASCCAGAGFGLGPLLAALRCSLAVASCCAGAGFGLGPLLAALRCSLAVASCCAGAGFGLGPLLAALRCSLAVAGAVIGHEVRRSTLHRGVQPAQVLAEQAEAEQLHGAEEQYGREHRRPALHR